jgi:DNA polymerase I-like protein with 3'-5' exonuclease and polymerase domains
VTLPVLIVMPPLFGQASQILTSALRTAGLGHAQVTTTLPNYATSPRVVVALGNDIAKQLVGAAWPDDGVHAVRGYWWDTPYGRVMGCVSPADIVTAWTPWRALLDFDMKRVAAEAAAGAPQLDKREVVICTTSAEVAELRTAMTASSLTAVDIENTHDNVLACVGFAPTPQCAWVIPAYEAWQLDAIRELCESPAPKVLQNGQYDRFFLQWFNNVTLRNQTFDVMLGWHSNNPELAGKAVQVGNRKARAGRTAKSLKFLASIYTRDPYWKLYDFSTPEEQYTLCGKDCCITLDIAIKQQAQLAQQGLTHIHDFEVALLDPCIAMTTRGLRVDDTKRVAMLAQLHAEHAPLTAEVERVALAALAAEAHRIPEAKAHLFSERKVCACCRNGKGKRGACWACAGFSKKPTKKTLSEPPTKPWPWLNIAWQWPTLGPCLQCSGAGAFTRAVFNPASTQQVAVVLYDVLRLPKRTSGGKVTTDEEALKSLLAEASAEAGGLIRDLLRLGKLDTIASILERVAPGEDGRIRTVYNPAGTVTGRFASSETFLVTSTNLSNLPKREVSEAMFDVKSVFIPDEGCVFVEADLSGAEAWIAAACAGDTDLLDKLRAGFKIHEWTAAYILTKMGKPTRMEDVTKEGFERQVFGKVPRHALGYGMQPPTLRKEINFVADVTGIAVTARQAQLIYDGYHELHPTLQQWWKRVLNQGISGTISTTFGRKRTCYGRGRGEWLSETHKSMIAQEPQSTIADLLNRGLLRWWRQHDGKHGQLLAQVYDSVLIQVPRAKAALCAQLVRRCLSEEIEVHGVKLTIPVDVKVLDSWAVMHD